MAAIFRKLFARKKQPPLVCAVELDPDGEPIGANPEHVHTDACFISFESLSVAELFQSQSCSSCPPAIPPIQAATADPNTLLLTYSVTLFDHTGWKDTFSSAFADTRQRGYAKRWARTSIFTPQIVVNGEADGSGPDKEAVLNIVSKAKEARHHRDFNIYVDSNDTEVRIDTSKQEITPHDVIIITFNADDQIVKVLRGPNKGKKINHRNVVRDVQKIGEWRGGNWVFPLPVPRSSYQGLGAVVLVQEANSGPIVAAAKI
ncbi:hypothetical protein LIA77_06572 [Sarocladium implicatum]|nr:hypothetical protein LIA77_06572 [Sarocladium implicatum]